MKNVILTFAIILSMIVSTNAQKHFWYGNLEVGGMSLVLTIETDNAITAEGVKALFGSPMQTPIKFDVEGLKTENENITFSIPKLGATFAGVINGSTEDLTGKFSQGGASFDMKFIKSSNPFTINRPQTPQSPFPYDVKQVNIPSSDGVELSATITSPKLEKGKKYPAVVLVSGSGPNDRDETIFMHKPFAVIADYLTRKGYIVIRYDKRGIGKSTGSYASATTFDFSDDANAVFEYLRNYKAVDKKKVGIIGHSEGGVIAPIVAKKNPNVNFIVLLAGPSIDASDIMIRQNKDFYINTNAPANVQESATMVLKQTFELLKTDISEKELEEGIIKAIKTCQESLSPEDFQKTGFPSEYEGQLAFIKQMNAPWFRTWIKHVPTEYLIGLKIPVLALYGERDVQVYCEQNYPLMEEILTKNGNKYSETVKIDGANHLFQSCTNGSVSEYGIIEETISPETLNLITAWLDTISKAKKLNSK